MKLQKLSLIALVLAGSCFSPRPADAAIIMAYDLRGSTVQNSLHFLNEPGGLLSGGTGGEIGAGIELDDNGDADPNTNTLLLLGRVGWGSASGFTNLTSSATASHLHGPTAGNNGGGGFTQTSGNVINLTRSSDLLAGGNFTNNLPFTSLQVTDLNNGKFYINLHTSTNTGGEIRGFIVPVPEPANMALFGAAGLMMLARRRRN